VRWGALAGGVDFAFSRKLHTAKARPAAASTTQSSRRQVTPARRDHQAAQRRAPAVRDVAGRLVDRGADQLSARRHRDQPGLQRRPGEQAGRDTMATLAVARAVDRVAGAHVAHRATVIPSRLVIRGTTGPAPAAIG
jgi:hypothetical protein